MKHAILRSISVILILSMMLGLMAGCKKKEEDLDPDWLNGTQTVPTTEEPVKELSVPELVKAILSLKSDTETVLDEVKAGEISDAREKLASMAENTAAVSLSLERTIESLDNSVPSLQEQMVNARELLSLLDMVSEKLLCPVIDELEKNPASGLKTEEGISTQWLCAYLDFAETLMPDIEAIVEKANTVDMSLIDSDGDMAEYLEKANGLLEMYKKDSTVIGRLKAMLGQGEDRVYLLAAQNSAEIRASGGFPGAMGVIRITDGILVVEDFHKVYDVLASHTPAQAEVTSQENNLFHGGMSAPRDADYCPDFERVAYIWALGYEAEQKEHIDGVISATPVLVQRLLEAMDKEIKLFDGTEIDGTNAVKILQHDMYFEYFGNHNYVANRSVVADQLFADAAKKTLTAITEDMGMDSLMGMLSVAKDSFADRTLMLWMEDEQEQAILRKMGWNGGLNTDPENPQIGIYYNCTVASKMGYFLLMDAEIGEGTQNSDGSYTYPVTVTFSNDITRDEINEASAYITGGIGGAIGGSAYFFAPAGGTVSDFTVNSGVNVEKNTYHDLELGHIRSFQIRSDNPVVVSYNVTTAPGVDTLPTLSMTPTVQEYH